MLRKLTIAVFLLLTGVAYGQTGTGSVKGKVIDGESKEPLPFVNISLEANGTIVAGGVTDFDGKYKIAPVPPGEYTMKFQFIGYQPKMITKVLINANKTRMMDPLSMSSGVELETYEVVEYTVPLISKDNTSSGGTVTREEIARMPGRSAASVAATVGGVQSKDNGSGAMSIRGSRTSGTAMYIDGIKVTGSNSLPQSAIQEVTVITGGLPAQYGDVTGGIISVTSRGASRQYFGGLEYVTSGYKIGDDVYGLDNYGYNLLEFSVSGPIMFKKDSTGKKTDPLFGFFLAGNYGNTVDGAPSLIGNWKLKDDVLADIKENPLRRNLTGTGANDNTDYLRLSDLEKTPYRRNAGSQSFNVSGKLDFNTGKNTNLTVGGNINYSLRNNYSIGNSLANWENNGEVEDITWRAFVRFTQRFGSGDAASDAKKASMIKNAFYSFQADYTEDYQTAQDANHQGELFNYGYVGKFQTFQDRDYEITEDDQGRRWNTHSTFVDTLLGFTPGTQNPNLAKITNDYYSAFGWEGYDANGNPIYDYEAANAMSAAIDQVNIPLNSVENLRTGQALINGDAPRSIYGMYSSPAAGYNNFSQFERNQFRLSATGSADIGDHAISVGFEFERRTTRSYTINPITNSGNPGIWNLGYQLMNTHIDELDLASADTTMTDFQIDYERLNAAPGAYSATDAQNFFDFKVREHLKLDTDGKDFVDFNNYDPSTYKLEFFSPDELLNGGQSVVGTYGYDMYGNRLSEDPKFEDYFVTPIDGNDADGDGQPDNSAYDVYGNPIRNVAPFQPIYMAGWIQDKFAFDDLIFNIGIRVDRFDANQKVIKDPYVLFPTIKASEQEALDLLGDANAHPETIGDDYVVYVDNIDKPTKITGYRNGQTWYTAEGTETDDLEKLMTGGKMNPLLLNKDQKAGSDLTSDSFEDYTPQVNVMPRIAFSFPVSDEALFFAHYDVLTQRPNTGLRVEPRDYFFIETLSTGSDIINNPSLKPQQSIDYELGFQQKLNSSSSLKLAAFYKEQRDMVTSFSYTEAYPKTYISYNNLDFSTVKGFTATYDLRRTGNIRMNLSYTLQFAEGTGSDANSGLGLVRAGKPNLRTINPLSYDQRHAITGSVDFRFGEKKEYNGPMIGDNQILKNTGVNFVINAGSGSPFSRSTLATATATGGGNGPLDGKVNGSRLPWSTSIDARIDRDMQLTFGKDDKKKVIGMNVYFQILNILNQTNINGVYRFSGNPDDDGYLASARAQKDIAEQNNELAYREYYTTSVNSPYNYLLPRRFRIGLAVNF